jgi:hypothetical protein
MPTGCNDLVLVHIDNKPAFYARIEEILADVKAGWWQVKLLVLTHPYQIYTWILDDSQINGAPFTMGGIPVVLEKVISPVTETDHEGSPQTEDTPGSSKKKGGNVVKLSDRKKNK